LVPLLPWLLHIWLLLFLPLLLPRHPLAWWHLELALRQQQLQDLLWHGLPPWVALLLPMHRVQHIHNMVWRIIRQLHKDLPRLNLRLRQLRLLLLLLLLLLASTGACCRAHPGPLLLRLLHLLFLLPCLVIIFILLLLLLLLLHLLLPLLLLFFLLLVLIILLLLLLLLRVLLPAPAGACCCTWRRCTAAACHLRPALPQRHARSLLDAPPCQPSHLASPRRCTCDGPCWCACACYWQGLLC
jgi:hypothetical protein